jgi:hypothetical protein
MPQSAFTIKSDQKSLCKPDSLLKDAGLAPLKQIANITPRVYKTEQAIMQTAGWKLWRRD